MTAFPWKISGKGTLRSGVVEATTDREALAKVLGGQVGFSPVPTESYSITVGPLTTSAYGDEFERVAGSTKIDESQLDKESGHLFNDPVRKQLEERARTEKLLDGDPVYPGALLDQMRRADRPCPANASGHHSFNLDSHIRKGDAGTFKHGRCTCGAITPTPVDSQPLRPMPVKVPVDPAPMSESLKKQFEQLDSISQQHAREVAERMMKEMIARTPVDTGRLRDLTFDPMSPHEQVVKRKIINLACAASQGGWRPEHARRIVRREQDCTVDVEFSDGRCMETIRLTDKEIALTRGF